MVKLSKRKINTRKALFILCIVLLLVLVAYGLELKGVTNLFGRTNSTLKESAQTTSDEPSAQSDYSDGGERDPGNTLREGRGSVTVTDNHGTPSTNTSAPTTSDSGEITVYLPTQNSIISKNKQELSGTSVLPTISYRVIDSKTGVIATGTVEVVNGRFSATLSFSTTASEGRIDIYATKEDGTEYSSVLIPVRFQL